MSIAWWNFHLQRGADRFGPKRLLVVELDGEASRLVTVSRSGSKLHWEKARELPPVNDALQIDSRPLSSFLKNEADGNTQYVSVVFNQTGSLVRLLNFTGQPGRSSVVSREVCQTLGVSAEEYAVRHRLVRRSEEKDKGEPEYAVLTAAVPHKQANALASEIQGAGMTPVSLVPHGIATANLAETSIDLMTNDKALGFLRVGQKSSLLVLYVAEKLALVRQFQTGLNALLETVMADYDLDEETAVKFVSSGSFDFSGNMSAAARQWIHQVGISLDFIERRYGQRVDDLFILGPAYGVAALRAAFEKPTDRDVKAWDALPKLRIADRPKDLENEEEFAVALCEAQRIMQEGLDAHA